MSSRDKAAADRSASCDSRRSDRIASFLAAAAASAPPMSSIAHCGRPDQHAAGSRGGPSAASSSARGGRLLERLLGGVELAEMRSSAPTAWAVPPSVRHDQAVSVMARAPGREVATGRSVGAAGLPREMRARRPRASSP